MNDNWSLAHAQHRLVFCANLAPGLNSPPTSDLFVESLENLLMALTRDQTRASKDGIKCGGKGKEPSHCPPLVLIIMIMKVSVLYMTIHMTMQYL